MWKHEVQPGPRLIVVGEQRCKLDSPPFRSFLRSSRPRSIVHASVRSLVQLASHGTQSVVVTDEARFSRGHMSEQVGTCFSLSVWFLYVYAEFPSRYFAFFFFSFFFFLFRPISRKTTDESRNCSTRLRIFRDTLPV